VRGSPLVTRPESTSRRVGSNGMLWTSSRTLIRFGPPFDSEAERTDSALNGVQSR
jgi:hypothetical protein